MQRLLELIDRRASEGKTIGLIGASAGASAVINAYAARSSKISACLLIAGKINHPESIGQAYRKRSPAFVTSATDCQAALNSLDEAARARIISRYAVFDGIVRTADSRIAGAHANRYAPTIGHAFTIATQLLFGVPSFIRFFKTLR